jgi:hypothetical protein
VQQFSWIMNQNSHARMEFGQMQYTNKPNQALHPTPFGLG